MAEAFRVAMAEYRSRVVERMRPPSRDPVSVIRPVFDGALFVASSVEELETEPAFLDLSRACRGKYGHPPHNPNAPDAWDQAVKDVLRRLGFYTSMLAGEAMTPGDLEGHFDRAFSAAQPRITYLVPLELVSFHKRRFAAQNFEVRCFSKNELDELLQPEVARSFYPYAVWETHKLQHYHFLVVHGEGKPELVGYPLAHFCLDTCFERLYWEATSYPEPVEEALAVLALFPWREDYWKETVQRPSDAQSEGPFCFSVPFIISVSSDLLARPTPARDCSGLETVPDPDRDYPLFFSSLDGPEEERFERFLVSTSTLMRKVGGLQKMPRWIRNALGFYLKALNVGQREGMMWNTVTIEALLGKNEQGLSGRLAERVDALGIVEEKRFKDLYGHRCALVHGSEDVAEKKVFRGDARDTRDIARRCLLWFLNFWAATLDLAPEIRPTKRNDVVDLISHRPGTWRAFKPAIELLPLEFPAVKTWTHG